MVLYLLYFGMIKESLNLENIYFMKGNTHYFILTGNLCKRMVQECFGEEKVSSREMYIRRSSEMDESSESFKKLRKCDCGR